ncbi:phage tail protein, partial [Pseudomonas sp. MYb118]|uniref:phage tail protein n=1 Tax=Pseudomonas sp. MYb118 TaxID=1848720 RepID=UPI0034CF57AF
GLAKPEQTRLINEWRRRPLNQLKVDPVDPSIIIAEQVIPADEGGRWIREIGLYDEAGDLVAVANCAPSYKPLLAQGSGRTQVVRMNFIVNNSGSVTIKIDPSVVLATRGYVDAAILEVLPANKTAGEYTRVKTNNRGLVVSGDNPNTLAAMGITDAFTRAEVLFTIQSQAATAFTTSGASPAYTLAPVPAIGVYAANLRYRVKFHEAGSGPATLNVSGRGAKELKQYDHTGAKVAAVIAAGQLVDVEYDGVDFVLMDRLPAPLASGVRGAFSNLKLSATGTNTNITISADELVLENADGLYKTVRNVALTINQGGSLDAGLITASTWYSVWVIASADGSAVAAITSLSATAPALPGGYTFKARVGWFRTDATGNKFPLAYCQFGRQARYAVTAGSNLVALPSMAGGVLGNPGAGGYVAVSLAPFVPVTAAAVDFFAFAQSAGAYYAVADTNAYGTYLSTTNPPPIASGASTSTSAVDFWRSMSRLMLTAGQNLYCASNAADFSMRCLGWEDNL